MRGRKWNREVASDQDMLMSILLLLVSFAAIAERASRLPLAACLEILCFLRNGEAVGRSLVSGAAREHDVALPQQAFVAFVEPLADQPAGIEAGGLAERFRQLAFWLSFIMMQARFFQRPAKIAEPAGHAAPLRGNRRRLAHPRRGFQPPPFPDTS